MRRPNSFNGGTFVVGVKVFIKVRVSKHHGHCSQKSGEKRMKCWLLREDDLKAESETRQEDGKNGREFDDMLGHGVEH